METVLESVQALNKQHAATFENEVPRVFAELRDNLLAVIRGLPGGIHKAADVHKITKVPAAIGWGVYKAATTSDVYEVGRYIPKRDALLKFLAAAEREGVHRASIAATETSLTAFEDLIERHAGDREMFESVLAGFTRERDASTDLRQKRAAFKANCYLAGMSAKMALSSIIVYPAAGKNSVDAVTINGHLKLTQLHPDTPPHAIWSKRTPHQNQRIMPLIPLADDLHGLGLIPDYCSKPLPEVTVELEADGTHRTKLANRGVGNLGSVDYITGNIIRDFCPASEDELEISTGISFPPVEVLVRDVLVHESLWPNAEVTARVYRSLLANQDTQRYDTSQLATVQERLQTLGPGLENAYCPDMPAYAELLADAMRQVGQDPASFRIYRCRVEYPILYSILQILILASTPSKPMERV